MCGIAGWIRSSEAPDKNILEAMNNSIAHRGPDAHAVWIDPESKIGLTHRRLSIIDPVSVSDQPMTDHTGQYVIVFNGEIYNYKILRTELQARGSNFKTHSDTEVLLEAYKAWGTDCLGRLIGMFAFCIWDSHRKQAFLARDRMGKKPLFYSLIDEAEGPSLAFASEPQALTKVPGASRGIDEKTLQAFLTLGYSTGEQTCWRGIKRLLPGHAMIIDAGRIKDFNIWQYYNFLSAFEQKTTMDEDAAAEQLALLIDDAVKYRLEADVPYGVFLSGGLDSNTVMSSMVGQIGPERTRTFSIGFEEKSYDESVIASQSAAYFGTRHQNFILDPRAIDIEKILDKAAQEPLADASFIAMHELSRSTREHVKMVLTGDGGDELFAGYPTYIANALHARTSPLLPKALWKMISASADNLMPPARQRMGFSFKLRQFMRGMGADRRRAHFSWRVTQSENSLRSLFAPGFSESFDLENIYDPFHSCFEEARHLSFLDQALYVDAKTWMVDSVVAKVDRSTMANGLEARSPFLDHRIVEFAASLPGPMKLKFTGTGFIKKHLLKKSQESRLPPFIFQQPKKGFSVPVGYWFGGHLQEVAREAIASPGLHRFLDKTSLETLFDQHHKKTRDHGLMLFNIIIMSRWLKKFS